MKLKIGVILPQSYRYPLMIHQFVNGMRACAHLFENMEVELVLRDSGAANQSAVSHAVNELLLSEKVDIITGVFGENTLPDLRDLFHQTQTPLIATNVGARIPYEEVKSPYIFMNTLNLWESCWHMGRWAVETHGKKVLLATGFYDGGYSLTYSFMEGAIHAGGEHIANYITPKIPWENSSEILQGIIRDEKPELVFGGYSGEDALRFLEDYHKIEPSKRIPLVVSPYLVDEILLDDHEDRAANLNSAFTWCPMLDTDGNKAFVRAFEAEAKRTPDGFAVLGYEVAGMIGSVVQQLDGFSTSKAFCKALAAGSFDGPRGSLKFDEANHRTHPDVWLRQVAQHDGEWANVPLKVLGSVAEAQDGMRHKDNTMHSGWMNPYLAV